MGFPDSSVGKEYTCNTGGPGLIPWLGRSAGEGIGYPLQCSWASFLAQLVKNPPAMWGTGVAIVNNTVECTFNYIKRINLMPGGFPNIPRTITQ